MARKKKDEEEVDDSGDLSPESLTSLLRKNHGEESVSQGKIVPARDYISTQSESLNYALGRPGIPVGRTTNIYGQEGSAKSTLVYHLLAEVQSKGGIGVLFDSEGAYDYDRGKRIGVKWDELVVIEAPHMEQAVDEFTDILKQSRAKPGRTILAAWDSVAATPTKAARDSKTGEVRPGEPARIISGALPDMNDLVVHTSTALVLVNQLRMKIRMGGMPVYSEDSIYTQIAEQAIKFYSSVRINLRAKSKIGDPAQPDGVNILANIVKNKVAPPFRRAEFPVMFWDGIDRVASMLDVAERVGLVKRSGSWYSLGETKFQSSKFVDVLTDNPGLIKDIQASCENWISDYEED